MKKLNFLLLLFSIIFGVLLYDAIQRWLNFTWTDEIICLVLVGYWLSVGRRIKEFGIFVAIALFYLIYSLLFPHNIFKAILTDFFIQVKPFVAFYTIVSLPFELTKTQKFHLRIICWICLVFMIPFGILGVGGGDFMRLLCIHSRFATMSIVLCMTYLYCSNYSRKSMYYGLLFLLVGLLSLRSKMFGFFIVYIFVIFIGDKIKKRGIFTVKNIFIGLSAIICAIYVAWDKINFYMFEGIRQGSEDEMMARPYLYMKAWEILKDYPLLGTGFGSYATHASAIYYSPLYIKYGMIYNYEIGNGLFLTDTFYPSLVQYGFIGIMLYVLFWISKYKRGLKVSKQIKNPAYFRMILLIIVFFVIESTSDSTFVQNRGMVMMMLLAMFLNKNYTRHLLFNHKI